MVSTEKLSDVKSIDSSLNKSSGSKVSRCKSLSLTFSGYFYSAVLSSFSMTIGATCSLFVTSALRSSSLIGFISITSNSVPFFSDSMIHTGVSVSLILITLLLFMELEVLFS